jgi:hypothetical protein
MRNASHDRDTKIPQMAYTENSLNKRIPLDELN